MVILKNYQQQEMEGKHICCRKGDPFQAPKLGSSEKNCPRRHVLTKQEILLGGHPSGEQQGKGSQENSSATWLAVSGFMVMGLVSRWSLATNHSNSVFPGGARIAQPRWMLERGILGSGPTRSVFFRPFSNCFSWWWLISSIFLIRISCHKTTHANGYYGAWPG